MDIKVVDKNVILAIIATFIIGVINVMKNLLGYRFCHNYSIIIGFLPFIYLLYRNHRYYRNDFKNYVVLTPTVVIVVVFIIIGNIVLTNMLDKSGIITDLNKYEKVLKLNDYENNKIIEHFPCTIPDNCENYKFKEWELLEKGGIGIYLSFDNKDYIKSNKKEISQYRKKAVCAIAGEGPVSTLRDYYELPDDLLKWLEKKENYKNIEVILLGGSDITAFRHGVCYGIAIDYNTYNILYFGEKW
ncbi:hypothetical protein KQI77_04060 [Clostridium sp. MSJ-8]|uniref:hypothetical protein n=1 Tax=Clostridium sp. MSJ-8 TaxID=2841510 RepID=UPI001C0F1ABF|nr:hypothetical protein [Clostridium sp. MSJ-8]MBU5487336.1 hypothetical protein [Clostridium sp. MSJ-8]